MRPPPGGRAGDWPEKMLRRKTGGSEAPAERQATKLASDVMVTLTPLVACASGRNPARSVTADGNHGNGVATNWLDSPSSRKCRR
jgi:hypothetical protein